VLCCALLCFATHSPCHAPLSFPILPGFRPSLTFTSPKCNPNPPFFTFCPRIPAPGFSFFPRNTGTGVRFRSATAAARADFVGAAPRPCFSAGAIAVRFFPSPFLPLAPFAPLPSSRSVPFATTRSLGSLGSIRSAVRSGEHCRRYPSLSVLLRLCPFANCEDGNK
jgi:hypothetical protein